MIKRIVDASTAIAMIPLIGFALLVIGLVIKLDSRGPILFSQTRVGMGMKSFTLYKFRTMKLGIGDFPSHVVGESGITRVGRWLRKTKLDELPQFINVLRGEMSLVGPRPCLPSQDELISARFSLGVFDVKPGITGLAQIEGLDMSDPELLAAKDAAYANGMSLTLDIKILLATLVGKGAGDAARNQG